MSRGARFRSVALATLLASSACAGAGPPVGGRPEAGLTEPAIGAPGVPAAAAGRPASVWDGVYTVAQARRGASTYAAECSSCHSRDLRGNSNAPSLVGSSFMFLWDNRPLGELFTVIRTQMPTNAPNSLTAASYLDIVAFLMEANGFPAGGRALMDDPDALGGLVITATR